MFFLHVFGLAKIDIFEKIGVKTSLFADYKIMGGKTAGVKKLSDILSGEKRLSQKNAISRTNLEDGVSAENDEKGTDDVKPYDKRACIIIAAASFILFFIVALVLNYYVFSEQRSVKEYFNFIKLFLVLVIVAAAALIDIKKKIIPNKLVAAGLLLRLVVYIGEVICCQDIIRNILTNDLIGLCLGFGFLFFAGLISGGAVGFGDAKLFAVVGLCTGYVCTFCTLFLSLTASAVASIILLIKYHDKKRAFAFAPFIFIGYVAVMFIGSF